MPPRGLPTLVVLSLVASSSVASLPSASFCDDAAACRSLALASRRNSALLAAHFGPSSLSSSPRARTTLLTPTATTCRFGFYFFGSVNPDMPPPNAPSTVLHTRADAALDKLDHLLRQDLSTADMVERQRRAAARKEQLQRKSPVAPGTCIECLSAAAEEPLPACRHQVNLEPHLCVCSTCLRTFEDDCTQWPLHARELSARRCPGCAPSS